MLLVEPPQNLPVLGLLTCLADLECGDGILVVVHVHPYPDHVCFNDVHPLVDLALGASEKELGGDWFSKLSKKKQKEYIKKHPYSKYAE